jgi:hypothetical protein
MYCLNLYTVCSKSPHTAEHAKFTNTKFIYKRYWPRHHFAFYVMSTVHKCHKSVLPTWLTTMLPIPACCWLSAAYLSHRDFSNTLYDQIQTDRYRLLNLIHVISNCFTALATLMTIYAVHYLWSKKKTWWHSHAMVSIWWLLTLRYTEQLQDGECQCNLIYTWFGANR